MELRHLRYFVQVAQDLHFARAARHLGISQPPLSQQIRALEDELGVRLLERTSRSVALTPAGRLFLDEARTTLAQADHAVTIARRAAAGELGELSIGFNASAPFVPRVARAIHDFRQAFPDVHLNLCEKGGPAQIEAVAERTLDVGFLRRSGPPPLPEGVTAVSLLTERLFVAMRPDHRFAERSELTLADLQGEPMLVYALDRSGGFTQEFMAMLADAGIRPHVAQTVAEISTMFGLAAAGLGITVLAESLCALQSANLVYRPLSDPRAVTGMWLIHQSDDITIPSRNFLRIAGAAS
ncbi:MULTISPECIES: LysR substrate-binding domain-containing protein [Sphingomonas]|uniref:LysR substrate-binding domain-containing protein n=1 Tax=Sphingomonas TaxID=13687 RepID=UPI000DEFBED9|nr:MULTISPECIES: LysR substrate-binding domain-containing protein [Sphingomonas]